MCALRVVQVISDFEEMKELIAKLVAGQDLSGLNLSEYELDEDTFNNNVAASEEGLPPVVMFAFDDYFPAVAATDMLVSLTFYASVQNYSCNCSIFVLLYYSSMCIPALLWNVICCPLRCFCCYYRYPC